MTKNNKQKVHRLREALPHGSISRIAKELKLSTNTVSGVLRGKWENLKVVEKAIEIIEEKERVSKRLEGLIQH